MKLGYKVIAAITCLVIILGNSDVTAQNQFKLGVKNGDLSHPLPGYNSISSGFGKRIHPTTGYQSFHYGIDFPAPKGTPVVAAASGKVVDRGWMGGAGNAILLEHEPLGQQTFYAHLSKIAVNTGQWVNRGSPIGHVGSTGNSTGPHLHFEVWEHNGNKWKAINPEKRLGVPDNRRPEPEPERREPCNPEPWAPCGTPRKGRQKSDGHCSIPEAPRLREIPVNNGTQFRQNYPEPAW